MTTNHLRPQAGGDPAQGPAPDVANPTPSPAAGNDLPDAPDEPDGPVQDRPDLDDFAERLGLRTPDETTESSTTSTARELTARTTNAVSSALASGLRRIARGCERLSNRLQSGR